MSNKKEQVTTASGKTISIDPNLIIDSIDDVNTLVNAHATLIRTVEKMVKAFIKGGLSEDEAAAVALEFHRRAAKKANAMTKAEEGNDEESGSEKTDSGNKPVKTGSEASEGSTGAV